MKLVVKLYRCDKSTGDEDKIVATLTFDGKKIVPDPPEASKYLDEKIWDNKAKRGVTAQSDPELYLSLLHTHFKSYALRASKVKELKSERSGSLFS